MVDQRIHVLAPLASDGTSRTCCGRSADDRDVFQFRSGVRTLADRLGAITAEGRICLASTCWRDFRPRRGEHRPPTAANTTSVPPISLLAGGAGSNEGATVHSQKTGPRAHNVSMNVSHWIRPEARTSIGSPSMLVALPVTSNVTVGSVSLAAIVAFFPCTPMSV